jgi:hypothetical protein
MTEGVDERPSTQRRAQQPTPRTGIFHPVGSDFTVSKATRSKLNAFGIEFEGKSGLSKSEFSCGA